MHAAVVDLGHLPDGGDGADGSHVARLRLVVVGVLQREEDEPISGERAIHRLDRHGSVDRERLQRQRKHDRLSKCEGGKVARVGARRVDRHDPALRMA